MDLTSQSDPSHPSALHVAYFNYCWRSRENKGGRQRLTPAMQAGITRELWDMERLYDEVMA